MQMVETEEANRELKQTVNSDQWKPGTVRTGNRSDSRQQTVNSRQQRAKRELMMSRQLGVH
jgi:hypothetical protein